MSSSAPAPSTKYSSKLHGKRILVFGGTSGIGFCAAEASVESGAMVILTGSKQSKLDKTVERLTTSYPDSKYCISTHVCDLANIGALDSNILSLLEAATNAGANKLDHIIFCAGDLFQPIPLSETTIEYIQMVSIVRFYAPTMLGKHIPKYMAASSESSITLTSGVNASKPGPGWSVLAAMGMAIEGLTRGLAVDLKPIRVNCVSPGAVHTELFHAIGRNQVEEMLEVYKAKTIVGRVGKPEDLAESYLYCMKDQFITGTILHSNGGTLLV